MDRIYFEDFLTARNFFQFKIINFVNKQNYIIFLK